MKCPKCQSNVQMLKFTTSGVMCRDCHKGVKEMVPASPSVIPTFYALPLGIPLYWRNEPTGRLPAAVKHYFDFCLGHCPDETAQELGIKPLSAEELKMLCDYCVYFIHAPCWNSTIPDCDERNQMNAELAALRVRSKTLASVESIRRWNDECMEMGIDPF